MILKNGVLPSTPHPTPWLHSWPKHLGMCFLTQETHCGGLNISLYCESHCSEPDTPFWVCIYNCHFERLSQHLDICLFHLPPQRTVCYRDTDKLRGRQERLQGGWSAKCPVRTHWKNWGTSLAVRWLRLHASPAEGPGSIPGQGTRAFLHATTKT